jgi:coenzyme F420-reducing hydrogenase beta subunit/polysaccharide pyruvyl transferase WcaK-like protein
MEYEEGQFLPIINSKKCNNCGLCFKLCPGIGISNFKNGANFEDELSGHYLNVYSSYSKDKNIRKNSTSGGLITQLIMKLLENDEYDGAFVLPFETFRNSPARLEIIKESKKIFNAAKSKYIPASVFNVIRVLQKEINPKYIIVGTPCQILGIKNFIKEKSIDCENLLFLGLFCDSTLNFNIINYFEDKYSKDNEKIIRFDFRNKEKDGWPGHPKIYFDSRREVIAHRKERMKVKKYFQLERCLYCLDKLNRSADISFGDCYLRWREFPESSTIIIRTEKGKKIFNNYSSLFNSVELNIEAVIKSQGISAKRENLDFVKALVRNKAFSNIDYSKTIDRKVQKRLTKRKKMIGYGKNFRINKIKVSSFVSDLINRLELIKALIKASTILVISLLEDTFSRNKIKQTQTEGNVIIVGGGLYGNIGAQAMTFTVVDQIRRKFPKKKIYLFSTSEFERSEREKDVYKFGIMPWGIGTKLNLLVEKQLIKREFVSDEWISQPEYQNEIKDLIKHTSFFIDVSGYRLGYRLFYNKNKEFSISIRSYDYLLNIMIAKKFSIPYYIFPQSFGPFNYPINEKIFLYPLMWKYLRYPKKIFSREEAGVKYLSQFTQKNLGQSRDIVLLNNGYKVNNIFKKNIQLKKPMISQDSVGVIPSLMVMKRIGEKEFFDIYKSIIIKVLQSGKKVYLLGHAQTDQSICKEIKDLFHNRKDVILISNNLNAFEIEKIISQFNFIVTSRYHSIVHAFKNGIPVLAIGWATKYFELMKDFNQLDYIFDTRKNLEKTKLLYSLEKLFKNYNTESQIIKSKLVHLEKNSAFEVLK